MGEVVEKTWPEWVDALGNIYSAGDIVAVSTINGRSPQLVIARVEKINRINSSGKEITAKKWFDHAEPIPKSRNRCYDRSQSHVHVDSCFYHYMEKGEYRPVPSCTIQATPLIDARGFGRYGKDAEGVNKKVTYSIPQNIILIERAVDLQ